MQTAQLNLIVAWAGLMLAFLSGAWLGLNFHRDQWLGGYGSLKRRLYRLAHISLFGLAVVNFVFVLTVQGLKSVNPSLTIASWAFATGAISMPICCVTMAHWPQTRLFFGVPIISLLLGGTLTLLIVAKQSFVVL